ncbi:MAG: YetF domain-containing protein [Bacteroidota bacterium]
MDPIIPFEWQRLFLSKDTPAFFLVEIAFRSFLMYLLILLALRVTGKRGVKQLSLFELTVILSLGSAAGDPMLYADTPLLHALPVFGVVIFFYLFFNWLTEQSEKVEQWLEGKPACLIEEGEINLEAFRKENLTYQELFGEIRQQQVEHLGQVRKVYIEATGELSIFFYPPEQVQPGLPIFPELLAKAISRIEVKGLYACRNCGHCQSLLPAEVIACKRCGKAHWLPACTDERVS